MIYPKNTTTILSTHFTTDEFRCKCSDCKTIFIEPKLITQLEAFRAVLGSKLDITSGYRCDGYQNQLRLRGYETSKGISQHTLGMAADVSNGVSPGVELEEMARRVGFESVGVGKHWIHVDLRPGYRRWTYSF